MKKDTNTILVMGATGQARQYGIAPTSFADFAAGIDWSAGNR